MKPPEPLENTPIYPWEGVMDCSRTLPHLYGLTDVREGKIKAKHRARQENMAALVGRWIDGHSRFCWCPFFYARNQVQRGGQAGVDAMGSIELPGIGWMVSTHSSALFHATARAPMQVLGLFFKTRSYCCVSLRYFATPSQNRMRMVAI